MLEEVRYAIVLVGFVARSSVNVNAHLKKEKSVMRLISVRTVAVGPPLFSLATRKPFDSVDTLVSGMLRIHSRAVVAAASE